MAPLRDLATDPYVPLIGSLPALADEEQALAFIQRQHGRLETGVGYSFCAADPATGSGLGTAGLWLTGIEQGRATVGYTVAPRARRRGVAVRALRALTWFAWTLPALFRLELLGTSRPYARPRSWDTSVRACFAATSGSAIGVLTCSSMPASGQATYRSISPPSFGGIGPPRTVVVRGSVTGHECDPGRRPASHGEMLAGSV